MATLLHQAGRAKLVGGGIDLGDVARSFQSEGVIETGDGTVINDTARKMSSHGGSANTVGGVMSGTYSAEGFMSNGADGDSAWEVIQRVFGEDTIIVSAPAGNIAGAPAVGLVAGTTNAGTPVGIGETVGFSISGETKNGFEPGVLLMPYSTQTGAVNGSTVDAGAASTGGAACFLALGEFVGTSCVVKVQHSTDGSSWSDYATFTTVTTSNDRGGERVEVAPGTLNRYRRAIIASGTFTSVELIVALVAK